MLIVSEQYLKQKLMEGDAIAKNAAVNHKRLVEVLLEDDVHCKDVVVVRVANPFMEQQLKGHEAQILKGDTLETLGGVVKAPQSLTYKYLVLCNTQSRTINGNKSRAGQRQGVDAADAPRQEEQQAVGQVQFDSV